MKTATLSLGLLATLTSAYSTPRRLRFARGALSNTTIIGSGTASAPASSVVLSTGVSSADPVLTTTAPPFPTNGTGAGITTLTVSTTSVRTITQCHPDVIDCPARTEDLAGLPSEALTTVIVTDTVVLTEVVCPVTAVPSISSSVLEDASKGVITGSTLTQPPASATVPAHVSISTATETAGETQTTAKVQPEGPGASTSPAVEEDTTTTETVTSTGTRTVTVKKPTTTTVGVQPTGGAGNGNGNGNGSGSGDDNSDGNDNGNGNGACECPSGVVTVTEAAVTVTVPASTVYVTVGAGHATTPAVEEADQTTKTIAASPTGVNNETGAVVDGEDDGEDDQDGENDENDEGEGEGDEACPSDVIVTVTSSATATEAETAAPTATDEAEETECTDEVVTVTSTATAKPTGLFPLPNNGTATTLAPSGTAPARLRRFQH